MANVVPLTEVPVNAFMKGFNHNSAQLEKLRRCKAKLTDGFFLFKDWCNVSDSFPLIGKYTGNWRLGRIRLTQNDAVYDYKVEIYRRSLQKNDTVGTVMLYLAKDDNDLADILRDLQRGFNINSYPSLWDIEPSDTFAKLEFDIV